MTRDLGGFFILLGMIVAGVALIWLVVWTIWWRHHNFPDALLLLGVGSSLLMFVGESLQKKANRESNQLPRE
jgi:hypothetical protein